MLGVGPQWVHLSQNGRVTNSIAREGAGRRNAAREVQRLPNAVTAFFRF